MISSLGFLLLSYTFSSVLRTALFNFLDGLDVKKTAAQLTVRSNRHGCKRGFDIVHLAGNVYAIIVKPMPPRTRSPCNPDILQGKIPCKQSCLSLVPAKIACGNPARQGSQDFEHLQHLNSIPAKTRLVLVPFESVFGHVVEGETGALPLLIDFGPKAAAPKA